MPASKSKTKPRSAVASSSKTSRQVEGTKNKNKENKVGKGIGKGKGKMKETDVEAGKTKINERDVSESGDGIRMIKTREKEKEKAKEKPVVRIRPLSFWAEKHEDEDGFLHRSSPPSSPPLPPNSPFYYTIDAATYSNPNSNLNPSSDQKPAILTRSERASTVGTPFPSSAMIGSGESSMVMATPNSGRGGGQRNQPSNQQQQQRQHQQSLLPNPDYLDNDNEEVTPTIYPSLPYPLCTIPLIPIDGAFNPIPFNVTAVNTNTNPNISNDHQYFLIPVNYEGSTTTVSTSPLNSTTTKTITKTSVRILSTSSQRISWIEKLIRRQDSRWRRTGLVTDLRGSVRVEIETDVEVETEIRVEVEKRNNHNNSDDDEEEEEEDERMSNEPETNLVKHKLRLLVGGHGLSKGLSLVSARRPQGLEAAWRRVIEAREEEKSRKMERARKGLVSEEEEQEQEEEGREGGKKGGQAKSKRKRADSKGADEGKKKELVLDWGWEWLEKRWEKEKKKKEKEKETAKVTDNEDENDCSSSSSVSSLDSEEYLDEDGIFLNQDELDEWKTRKTEEKKREKLKRRERVKWRKENTMDVDVDERIEVGVAVEGEVEHTEDVEGRTAGDEGEPFDYQEVGAPTDQENSPRPGKRRKLRENQDTSTSAVRAAAAVEVNTIKTSRGPRLDVGTVTAISQVQSHHDPLLFTFPDVPVPPNSLVTPVDTPNFSNSTPNQTGPKSQTSNKSHSDSDKGRTSTGTSSSNATIPSGIGWNCENSSMILNQNLGVDLGNGISIGLTIGGTEDHYQDAGLVQKAGGNGKENVDEESGEGDEVMEIDRETFSQNTTTSLSNTRDGGVSSGRRRENRTRKYEERLKSEENPGRIDETGSDPGEISLPTSKTNGILAPPSSPIISQEASRKNGGKTNEKTVEADPAGSSDSDSEAGQEPSKSTTERKQPSLQPSANTRTNGKQPSLSGSSTSSLERNQPIATVFSSGKPGKGNDRKGTLSRVRGSSSHRGSASESERPKKNLSSLKAMAVARSTSVPTDQEGTQRTSSNQPLQKARPSSSAPARPRPLDPIPDTESSKNGIEAKLPPSQEELVRNRTAINTEVGAIDGAKQTQEASFLASDTDGEGEGELTLKDKHIASEACKLLAKDLGEDKSDEFDQGRNKGQRKISRDFQRLLPLSNQEEEETSNQTPSRETGEATGDTTEEESSDEEAERSLAKDLEASALIRKRNKSLGLIAPEAISKDSPNSKKNQKVIPLNQEPPKSSPKITTRGEGGDEGAVLQESSDREGKCVGGSVLPPPSPSKSTTRLVSVSPDDNPNLPSRNAGAISNPQGERLTNLDPVIPDAKVKTTDTYFMGSQTELASGSSLRVHGSPSKETETRSRSTSASINIHHPRFQLSPSQPTHPALVPIYKRGEAERRQAEENGEEGIATKKAKKDKRKDTVKDKEKAGKKEMMQKGKGVAGRKRVNSNLISSDEELEGEQVDELESSQSPPKARPKRRNPKPTSRSKEKAATGQLATNISGSKASSKSISQPPQLKPKGKSKPQPPVECEPDPDEDDELAGSQSQLAIAALVPHPNLQPNIAQTGSNNMSVGDPEFELSFPPGLPTSTPVPVSRASSNQDSPHPQAPPGPSPPHVMSSPTSIPDQRRTPRSARTKTVSFNTPSNLLHPNTDRTPSTTGRPRDFKLGSGSLSRWQPSQSESQAPVSLGDVVGVDDEITSSQCGDLTEIEQLVRLE